MSELNNKKILLIGNPNHVFIKNLVKSVNKIDSNFKFDIFSTNPSIDIESKEIYNKIYNPFTINTNIPLVRKYIKRFQFIYHLKKIKSRYDVTHIQYIDYAISYNSKFVIQLKKISNRTIASIWGSDFFKKSSKQLKTETDFYKNLDSVILQTTYHEQLFKKKFNTPVVVTTVGTDIIDEIKNTSMKINHRKNLNLPENRINITIGYNNAENQQHLEIIDSLSRSNYLNKNKEDFHFLVPLTYPKNESYKSSIISALNNSGLSYTIFDEFMNTEEVVSLRNSTDVLVQLQMTDALSASMLETIYAGNTVITGSWLPYDVLKDLGVPLQLIDSIDELGEKLQELVENLEKEKENSKTSQDVLYNMLSLEKNAEKWSHYYKNL